MQRVTLVCAFLFLSAFLLALCPIQADIAAAGDNDDNDDDNDDNVFVRIADVGAGQGERIKLHVNCYE